MSLLPSRAPETNTSQDGELQIVGVDDDVSAVLDALSSETARDILNAVYAEPGTPSELADRLDMSIQKVSYHLEKLEDQELIAVAGTQYSEKGQEMTVYEPPQDPLVVFVGTPDRKRTLRSLVERLVPAVGLLTAASLMVQFLFGTFPSLFTTGSSGGAPESGGDASQPESGAAATNETERTATPDSEPVGAETNGTQATPEPTSGDDGGGISIMEQTEEPTEAPAPDTPAPDTPVPDAPTPGTQLVQETTETVTTAAAGGGFDLEPGVAFFLGGLLVLAVVGVTWAYTN